jgi:hypothetical protein
VAEEPYTVDDLVAGGGASPGSGRDTGIVARAVALACGVG